MKLKKIFTDFTRNFINFTRILLKNIFLYTYFLFFLFFSIFLFFFLKSAYHFRLIYFTGLIEHDKFCQGITWPQQYRCRTRFFFLKNRSEKQVYACRKQNPSIDALLFLLFLFYSLIFIKINFFFNKIFIDYKIFQKNSTQK